MSEKKERIFFIFLIQFLIIFSEQTCEAQSATDAPVISLKSFRRSLFNPIEIGKDITSIGKDITSNKIVGSIYNPWGAVKNLTENLPNPFNGAEGIFQKIPESVIDPMESIKNLTGGITDLTEMEKNIQDLIPDPKEIVDHLSELVDTTATFVKNNVTLNCFGVPIALFANVIERIFTQTTEARNVRFYFFSRNQLNNVTIHVDEIFTLDMINFDVKRPTILIVHGFMSSGRESWLTDMKDAFLSLADVNVILVDWQEGSNTWNYYSAAISTRIVGLEIAKLFAQIRHRVRNSPNPPKVSEWGPIYFIGHSLGSHISGHAALLIRESQTNEGERWIVNRITGLDPAQPCFTSANLTLKLDKTDAPYVDIIHTNARNLLLLGLGLPEKLGYVDFYPNGGAAQPGCFNIDISLWGFMMLPKEVVQQSICSHGRSHAFLTESIRNAAAKNCSFIGHKWDRKSKPVGLSKELCDKDGCAEMGVNSIRNFPNNKGIFYVPTRETYPFCEQKLTL